MKYKALLLRFVPIVLVMFLTAMVSNMLFQNMVEDTREKCWEELSMVRDEAAGKVGTVLGDHVKMLHLAAEAIALKTGLSDETAVRAYLADMIHESIFDRIDVIFPDGSVLVQSTGVHMEDGSGESFDGLLEKGAHLSQRVPDFLTGQQAVCAYEPVYDSHGDPVAMLSGTIYCTTLADMFSTSHYEADSQLFLVDMRNGDLVLDKWHEVPGSIYDMLGYTPSDAYSGTDVITDIMSGKSGRLDYESQRYGQTSYTVYSPVQGMPFSLIMVVQEDVLFKDVNELKATLIRVGGTEMLLLLFFTLWIYFILRRSLQNEGRAQQAELALLQQKEQKLESQYADAANRQAFLEVMALNLPGGYHRCTTDHDFRLSFASKSFTQITGYTLEQLEQDFGGSYMGVVDPRDREYFMSMAPQLERDGFIHCAYRICRRDGQVRWVQDSTQYVERDGEQYYQCALMDISERVEELERAKQVAEASSRAKSTFLFNISHDIRTPMNAIQGFSHMIEENSNDPKLVLETVRKIRQAGEALMMLINDVLDISRIERGKDELNLQSTNLQELGKSLYEMFAADMAGAGIQFEMEMDALTDRVYCDQLKMTRIIMNMLSNAKKFTPFGGTVVCGGTRLHSDGEKGTYRFYVRDTGIGMSPEFLQRAFEQFERERTSTESGVTGSGLGLAIVKMLAELMGGTVDIRSELGQGTEISATLTFRLAKEEKHAQSVQDPYAIDLTGKHVLLVEDNDFNREIAKYILEGMGFVVAEAENGAVCLEKLLVAQPDQFDLVLMDIQMPVMDGYTASSEIRRLADPKLAMIPIVAMTANAFEEDKRKCLEMGMDAHIGKPIDMKALIKVLSEVLH